MGSNVLLYGRLVLFSILLPLILSYAYFQRQVTDKGLITVRIVQTTSSSSDGSTLAEFAGVYRPAGPRLFRQQVKAWVSNVGFFEPDVVALAHHLNENRVTDRKLELSTRTNQWCFVSSNDNGDTYSLPCQSTLQGPWVQPGTKTSTLIIASKGNTQGDGGSARRFSGQWLLSFLPGGTTLKASSSSSSFRRNPARQARPHRNLAWLLDHPATAVCLVSNIGIAAGYAFFKVPASSTALLYSKIVRDGQLWRVLTGATAHYEWWHLGLNMAGLYGLGSKLEGRFFSSVEFLFYNLSMIPLTGAVWLCMQRCLRRATTIDVDVPTVGYSGVLYAWLAVSALMDGKDDWLKSLGGMLFYTVVYSAMPGISISGHLAGVVVGVSLYAGMIPLTLFQPSVLVPVSYFAHCYFVRKLFYFHANDTESTATSSRWTLGTDKSQELHRILFWLLLSSSILSCVVFGPLNPISLSSMATLIYWRYCDKYGSNGSVQVVLLRGFVVSTVLLVITDGMSVGAWLAISSTGLLQIGVMLLRWLTHGAALSLACHMLAQQDVERVAGTFEYTGVFTYTLGWTTILPAESLGKLLLHWQQKRAVTTLTPFGGPEQVLGNRAQFGIDNGNPDGSSLFSGNGRVLGNGRRSTPNLELVEQGEVSRLL
jgi:membrane associated rhomboid family serine protease